ncbi:MAG TPA: S9 family peptidase [Allosphingosinicella sp.]
MIYKKILACLAFALASVPLGAQTIPDPAIAFGARENVQSIIISPSGNRIAYVSPGQGSATHLYTVDLANPAPRVAGTADGRQRLGSCRFISDERLVCTIYSIEDVGGRLTTVSQLIALGVDGSDIKPLGERNSITQLYARTWSGHVIDHSGGSPNTVLMEQLFIPEQQAGTILNRNREGLGVVRLDTRTLRSSVVENPRPTAERFISDGRGRVRLVALRQFQGNSQATNRTAYMYRQAGRDEWQEFGIFDSATNEGLLPVAVDSTLNVAYAFAKLNGRMAVYRVSLDGSMRRELVASHASVDVDDLITVGRSHRVVGASFATERRRAIYFDPELQQLVQRLHRALPNQPAIDIIDASDDENKLLIVAASDNDPGQYYLYDRATRQLAPLLRARPQLEGVALATVRPVTYRAADGTQIPAYLTLPPNGGGRGLPAIVLPHGGPAARDEWGFDWLAQYFANRGFAVLQPNFRGSSGYGEAWYRENGFRAWRTAIGDVNDAGRWLVSEGIADPAKLAIVGWSYGGYAALQSSVLDQALFKAVVAIAPVTDLELARNVGLRTTISAIMRDYFGTGPHIVEGSPARNAAAIRAPVLLFHGARDLNVSLDHSRLMEERLRAAGRPAELVVYESLDHQLDDSGARADMLRRSDAFLRRSLGLSD